MDISLVVEHDGRFIDISEIYAGVVVQNAFIKLLSLYEQGFSEENLLKGVLYGYRRVLEDGHAVGVGKNMQDLFVREAMSFRLMTFVPGIQVCALNYRCCLTLMRRLLECNAIPQTHTG